MSLTLVRVSCSHGRMARPNRKAVAELISAGRRKKKMTREQLATAVGVSYHAVTSWELGDRAPRAEHVAKLSSVLGLSADKIVSAAAQGVA